MQDIYSDAGYRREDWNDVRDKIAAMVEHIGGAKTLKLLYKSIPRWKLKRPPMPRTKQTPGTAQSSSKSRRAARPPGAIPPARVDSVPRTRVNPAPQAQINARQQTHAGTMSQPQMGNMTAAQMAAMAHSHMGNIPVNYQTQGSYNS
jgi:hypothetical protein